MCRMRPHTAVIRVYDASGQRDRDTRARGRFQRTIKRSRRGLGRVVVVWSQFEHNFSTATMNYCKAKFVLRNKCRWRYIFRHGNGIESCSMKKKSETQILREDHARDALLDGGTVDSFVNPYHPDLRFPAFRAYINAVRNALFRPRTGRRPPST